jgi:hypothetical protein
MNEDFVQPKNRYKAV